MPITLFRVDERLIHGQVVIGWGSQLRPDRYVIVDDDVASSDWEQDLYALGLPDGTLSEFVAVDEAAERLAEWERQELATVVLVRDLEATLRLARAGALAGMSVNLGGIHHGPGREPVLGYVYLDDADRARLRELSALGVKVAARDLPGAKEVSLSALLG